jgi:hypothetical protein
MALFIGSTLYTSGVSISSDSTSATFYTGRLSYGTSFTAVVSPNVTDASGNPLGSEFTSTFATIPSDNTTHPSVTAFRPGQGASSVDPNTPLIFFINSPINPSTVNGAINVAVNGAVISGSVSVDSTNQIVTFTPSAPLASGGIVQVWLSSAATDNFGNSLYTYYASFTVAPDLSTTPPSVVNAYPSCCNNPAPLNTVVDIQFNKPINYSTVNSNNFYVSDCNGDCGWYAPVPINATISQVSPNVVRLTPSSPLNPGDSYRVGLHGFEYDRHVAAVGCRICADPKFNRYRRQRNHPGHLQQEHRSADHHSAGSDVDRRREYDSLHLQLRQRQPSLAHTGERAAGFLSGYGFGWQWHHGRSRQRNISGVGDVSALLRWSPARSRTATPMCRSPACSR